MKHEELQGGFTVQEQLSLESIRQAALSGLELLRTQGGKAGLEEATRGVVDCLYKLYQSAGWLFHVNVNPNTVAGESFLAGDRGEVVAAAWRHLDRSLFELGRARSDLGSNRHFARVESHVANVDRSLAYATPWPVFSVATLPDGSTLGSDPHNQFGPHGNYPAAQRTIWKVMQYGEGALNGWMNGQEAGELPEAPGLCAQYAGLLKLNLNVFYLSAHALSADSGFENWQTEAEQGLPEPAKRALTEIHLNAGPDDSGPPDSVSYHFRFVNQAVADALKPTHPHLWEFLRRMADSWENAHAWQGHFNIIL